MSGSHRGLSRMCRARIGALAVPLPWHAPVASPRAPGYRRPRRHRCPSTPSSPPPVTSSPSRSRRPCSRAPAPPLRAAASPRRCRAVASSRPPGRATRWSPKSSRPRRCRCSRASGRSRTRCRSIAPSPWSMPCPPTTFAGSPWATRSSARCGRATASDRRERCSASRSPSPRMAACGRGRRRRQGAREDRRVDPRRRRAAAASTRGREGTRRAGAGARSGAGRERRREGQGAL